MALYLSGCAAQGPYFKLDSSLEKDIRTFSGANYVPLVKLCDIYGLKWNWDQFTKTAIIEKGGKTIVLRAGSDRILVNKEERKLDKPVLLSNSAVFVPVSFARNNLGDMAGKGFVEKAPYQETPGRFKIKTVVVDSGHGGRDPGAIGRKLRFKEKNLTLDIAKRLKELLEKSGLKVIMTRNDDTFIPLSKRVQIVNRSGAELFVSVHINASRTRALKGFECYFLSNTANDNARALEALENASLKLDEANISRHFRALDATLWDMVLTEYRAESADLANRICDAVGESLAMKNRGVRSARFYVLKGALMPSVLIEMGYISNRYEEIKLKESAFLDKMTGAIAKGILDYKREYENTEGYTNI